MKPKTQFSFFDHLQYKVRLVWLYRADLEEILRIAQARGLKTRISDDRNEYDSLDDLREHRGEHVRNLSIDFTDGKPFESANFKIGPDGVVLQTDKSDKLILFWQEAKEMLEKRAPWYSALTRPLPLLWAAVIVLWLPLKAFNGKEWSSPVALAWTGSGLFLFIAAAVSQFFLWQSQSVYLKREHEVQGFWTRNGEKLIVLGIGAFLGALCTAIVNRLLP